jgi:hypothetical protein
MVSMRRAPSLILLMLAMGCSGDAAEPPSSSTSTTGRIDVCGEISAEVLSTLVPGATVARPADRTGATDIPPLGDCRYDLPGGEYLWLRVVRSDATLLDDVTKENGYGSVIDGPPVGEKVFYMRVDDRLVSHARGNSVAVELDGPIDPATAAEVHKLVLARYDH